MSAPLNFDPRTRRLQFLIQSTDWQSLIVPMLQAQIEHFTTLLRDPADARKKKLPDDYVRGCLDMAEFLLKWPQEQVNGAIADLTQEILARQFSAEYVDSEPSGLPAQEE